MRAKAEIFKRLEIGGGRSVWLWVWGVTEVVDIAIWEQATDNWGATRVLGFGGDFAAAVASPLVFDGPAASAGAVGFEVVPAVEFAGGRGVGGGWFAGQEFSSRASTSVGRAG